MGSTYYVSATNGNNNNPGNDPNYPLRTIQAAINKAQSGDSITVRGGTYTERLHIQKPGTAGASFAITTDPGEQAIIDGTGLDIPEDAALVVIQQSQNVSLTGLTIRNSVGCGILVGKSSQITIDGCKVEYCQAGGLFADQCDTLLVQKCDISGCARRFLADGASDTNSALGVRQSRDVTIQENLVHENSDRGIAILSGCEKVKAFRNTCYDNRNGQIGITSSVDVLIDSNLCYHTGNTELLTLQGQRGPGITKHDLAQYRTGGMWHTRNIRVVNNYIVGCGVGFQTSRTGGQLTDFQLAHNTILNSTESLLDINVINAGTLSYIENNVLAAANGNGIVHISNGAGVIWRNNLWSDFPGMNIFNPVSDIVEANIGLVDIDAPVVAGEVKPDAYKLAGGSVAIDRGIPRDGVATVDFWGNSRAGAPDIGANEFPNPTTREPARSAALPRSGDRITDGLSALYTFKEGKGRDVKDVSNAGQALNLRITNESAVQWTNDGLLVKTPVRIISDQPARKIIDACRASNEITLEAWIVPANTTQDGPARIISLSKNKVERNFTLGQGLWDNQPQNLYMARLRTTQTSTNGLPAVISPAGTATATLSHVVYTRSSDGQATLYVNGQARSALKIAGNFDTWDNTMQLMLADELSDDRPWLGLYRLVAVYSRALSAGEVLHNYEATFITDNTLTVSFRIVTGGGRGVAPHTVEFDSSDSVATAGIATYYWEFGDGQTSNQANPTHTYEAAGVYSVSLTVTDKKGSVKKLVHPDLITVVPAPLAPVPPEYARFMLVEIGTSAIRAFGIQYPNFRCAIAWNDGGPAIQMFFASVDDVARTFTDETTKLIWVDESGAD